MVFTPLQTPIKSNQKQNHFFPTLTEPMLPHSHNTSTTPTKEQQEQDEKQRIKEQEKAKAVREKAKAKAAKQKAKELRRRERRIDHANLTGGVFTQNYKKNDGSISWWKLCCF